MLITEINDFAKTILIAKKKKKVRNNLGMMAHARKTCLQMIITVLMIRKEKKEMCKGSRIQPQDTFKFLAIC